MSQAFVKEGDDQWLHEIQPTMNALIVYLSKENGIQITERNSYFSKEEGRQVHEMSDGMKYMINRDGKWEMLPES
jgi:hypothetical protein